MNSNEFFRCLQFFLPKITMIYIHGAVNANDFQSPQGRASMITMSCSEISEDVTEQDIKGMNLSMPFLFPAGLNSRNKNRPHSSFSSSPPSHPSHQFQPPSPSKTETQAWPGVQAELTSA